MTLFCTGGRKAEKEAKRLSRFCRTQLNDMFKAGLSPLDALMETIPIEIVQLHKVGPLTRECAYAILFLETKRRIFEKEVAYNVH